MNIAEIHAMASEARGQFERREIDPAQLAKLYVNFNPLEDVTSFVTRAAELFPHLNCGIASVYLQFRLNAGKVIQGSFNKQNHTFLEIGDDTIVDITADQYGGPKTYVGPLEPPWSLIKNDAASE